MYTLRANRPTTVIYIQVRRYEETYFLLCDEYDPVESVKSRILTMLEQTGFKLDRQEEPLTTDDLRLHLKKRVSSGSFHFLCLTLRHFSTQVLDSTATCHD